MHYKANTLNNNIYMFGLTIPYTNYIDTPTHYSYIQEPGYTNLLIHKDKNIALQEEVLLFTLH